jgi:hypothetical protein
MYTAAMIIVWIAIILTVLEIIAKVFVQSQDNNQEENKDQENTEDKKE